MTVSRYLAYGAIASAAVAAISIPFGDPAAPTNTSAVASQSAPEPDIQVSPQLAHAMHRDLGITPKQLPRYQKVQQQASVTEEQAKRHFGRQYAGTWMENDEKGEPRIVVAATGAHGHIEGAEVRQVRYSMQELDAVVTQLNDVFTHSVDNSKINGVQSWGIDPTTNSVMLSVREGREKDAVDFAAASGIDVNAIRIETTKGVALPTAVDIDGGIRYDMPASNGGYDLCSIGFSVTKGTAKGFVTAGHCGGTRVGKAAEVYQSPTNQTRGDTRERVGTFQAAAFDGTGDMAWVSVGSTHTLWADAYNYDTGGWLDVKGSTESTVGAAVCRYGISSGWSCGTIEATNVTVVFKDGPTVKGLRQSNACTTQGDSGGTWLTPTGQGQGVTSGGDLDRDKKTNVDLDDGVIKSETNCHWSPSVRKTYYQPLKPILSRYGLTLKTQ